MEVPLRLQKRATLLLQQADTALLERELWAAETALRAYRIFDEVDVGSSEEFLRIRGIARENWDQLTRDEQLSAAAIGCSYTWRPQQEEYSCATVWVQQLILYQGEKLWCPDLLDQIITIFQYSIETLWRPEQDYGLIALLMQLEERYEEYFTGEPFNEKICNQGLQYLDEWFAAMPLKQSRDTTYPVFTMARLQIVRQRMNRIYAYLIEGKNQAQEMRNDFPDPASMPHRTAAAILLCMIEENRGGFDCIRNKQEACAFSHIREHEHDTDTRSACKKLLLWLENADTIPYFRFPDQNRESRAFIDEIYQTQEYNGGES